MKSLTRDTVAFAAPLCSPLTPVIAIGDVHGYADQLEAAVDYANGVLSAKPDASLVFLGDLINRGPDSWRCLQLAASARDRFPGRVHLLAGKNEQLMLAALYEPNTTLQQHALHNWTTCGGDSFLDGSVHGSLDDICNALRDLSLELPAWASHVTNGNLLFVHGGVPSNLTDEDIEAFLAKSILDVPTDAGSAHYHWAWLRNTTDLMPWPGHFVVHAHTPWDFRKAPRPGRLNLDAGPEKTGRVAAALLTEGRVEVSVFGF